MQDLKQYLVQHVDDGYHVVWCELHSDESEPDLIPVNDKVYFHPTSAYAALGRLVHAQLVEVIGYAADPAKAPKQDKAE